MDTKDCTILKTLAEENNITYAARRLFMTQPALSERIKKLEKEFNCPIINRQARGVEFTYQGQRLVRYAEDLLNSYTSVRQELLAMSSEPRGTLNLGCSNVFAKYHIPHILSTFKETYPHIDIIMYTGLSYKLYHDFLEGRLHAAIIRGAHTWAESKEHIWSEPFCFFNKTPCTVEELPRLPYIHYQTNPNLQQTIDDWWYSHYSQPPMRTIEVNDIDTCMKLVNQGLGFTILTQSCGNDYPNLFKETLKTLDGHIMTRDTWMYTRHSALESKPVQAFYSFMKTWAETKV